MNYNINNLDKLLTNCNFQKLQDEVAGATQVAMIAVDYKGKPLTQHSSCSEFCSLVRSNPKYKAMCEKCDSRGGLEAARIQSPFIYKCHMGLVDFAVPIISEGLYIGAVMSGQVKAADGTMEDIVAEKNIGDIAIDSKLNAAYDKLPTMSFERITSLARMIFYICNYVIEQSVQKSAPMSIQTLTPSSITKVNNNLNTIKPAIDYIDKNYTSEITLTHLAMLCGVSTSYFSKIFMKCMRTNLASYINTLRINHAKNLLLNTDRTVVSIALEVGFDDCGYFIKNFKKITGVTPNKFRNNQFS